jgi:hypothetical protein
MRSRPLNPDESGGCAGPINNLNDLTIKNLKDLTIKNLKDLTPGGPGLRVPTRVGRIYDGCRPVHQPLLHRGFTPTNAKRFR